MEKIYLDNNATTMVDPVVLSEMEPFFCERYGNPNSLHSFGSELYADLTKALNQLYKGLNAPDDADLVINSGATEGNNAVLKSLFIDSIGEKGLRLIISPVEHPNIRNGAQFLEKHGAEVVVLPLLPTGLVSVEALEQELQKESDKQTLVSVMWANNETGLINPVKEISDLCIKYKVLFHSDATQAVGKVVVDVQAVPVDFLTFSAHKFHGPKGVGGLYIKAGIKLEPTFHGGEQMGGLRAGTVNTPFFVGMGKAMELAVEALPFEESDVRRLRDKLEDGLIALGDVEIIGDRALRTPNTILAGIKGVEGEAFLWDLNQAGVAASTGSACSSEELEADATFQVMDIDNLLTHSGVRFSLSRFTTEDEIDRALEVISVATKRLRAISSTY